MIIVRNNDIVILEKVAIALAQYLPEDKNSLLGEYYRVFQRLKSTNDKQKQNYADNARYYREKSREWKKSNPEKHRQHMADYLAKKNQKKEGSNDDA